MKQSRILPWGDENSGKGWVVTMQPMLTTEYDTPGQESIVLARRWGWQARREAARRNQGARLARYKARRVFDLPLIVIKEDCR